MKIVSWNLYHRAGASIEEVSDLIRRERPDLLLMQECTERLDALPHRVRGSYVRHPLPDRRHGLAAWSSAPLPHEPAAMPLEPGVIFRRVCQIIDFDDFAIANVHLSHGQFLNRRQLRQIAEMLPPRAAVIGDCNLIGPALLGGFQDVGPRLATHRAGALLPLRLDRCFVRGLVCEGARVLAGPTGSDHRPIAVELRHP